MKLAFVLVSATVLVAQLLNQRGPGQTRYQLVSLTAKQIQAMIDDRYEHQGGVVNLPAGTHDLGTTPLHVYSVITLKGDHLSNTIIRYHGKGPAILLDEYKSRNGHSASTFCDFRLFSDDQGIGYAESQKELEGGDITIHDVELYTHGTALLLGKEGRYSYQVRLERMMTNNSADYPGVDLRNCISYDLAMVKIHHDGKEPTQESFAMLAGITGTIGRGTIIEGPWKKGGIFVKRELSFDGVHMELPHGAMTIDGGEVTVGQYSFFAGPDAPIRLSNGAKLFVSGTLGFKDIGGGFPKRAAYKNPADFKAAIEELRSRVYLCDETSGVYEHGQLVVGHEPPLDK